MNLQKTFLWFLLSLISLPYFAQDLQFEEFDLDNGLHVILHRDDALPIAAVSVLYHVGSKNEDPQRTGFAHFFEHLMFEGSPNIDRGQYMKIVQGAGGELNAYTSFDRTYYYEIIPSNELQLALWLESERMLQLKVDSIGVETQRQVVKEERRLRYDNRPYGRVSEEVYKRAFKTHPYRWTPIGSLEYINKASLGEFMDFYKTFYVPNNAVLTIAGNFEINQAKDWIKQYFGSIPKGTKAIPRPTIRETPTTAEVKDTVYDKIQLPMIVHAYHTPEMTHPDFYAVDLLTMAMSDGETSRLYKKMVDETQLASSVFAYSQEMENPGLTFIQSVAQKGVTLPTLDSLINGEIQKLQNELITQDEYIAIMNKTENQLVSVKGSLASVAGTLAGDYVFHNKNTELINKKMDGYRKVTREDIRRVAKQYFIKENRVNLSVLPKTN